MKSLQTTTKTFHKKFKRRNAYLHFGKFL